MRRAGRGEFPDDFDSPEGARKPKKVDRGKAREFKRAESKSVTNTTAAIESRAVHGRGHLRLIYSTEKDPETAENSGPQGREQPQTSPEGNQIFLALLGSTINGKIEELRKLMNDHPDLEFTGSLLGNAQISLEPMLEDIAKQFEIAKKNIENEGRMEEESQLLKKELQTMEEALDVYLDGVKDRLRQFPELNQELSPEPKEAPETIVRPTPPETETTLPQDVQELAEALARSKALLERLGDSGIVKKKIKQVGLHGLVKALRDGDIEAEMHKLKRLEKGERRNSLTKRSQAWVDNVLAGLHELESLAATLSEKQERSKSATLSIDGIFASVEGGSAILERLKLDLRDFLDQIRNVLQGRKMSAGRRDDILFEEMGAYLDEWLKTLEETGLILQKEEKKRLKLELSQEFLSKGRNRRA